MSVDTLHWIESHVQVLEQINLSLQLSAYILSWRDMLLYLYHTQFASRKVRDFDLFDRYSLASAPVEGFIHGPKGTLSQTFAEALQDTISIVF